MKNIFLSRPNWVHPNYKDGLDNFLNLLKSNDLNPRTIGATDFPNKSPMDEVIDLLYQCEGVLILGYRQIQVNVGKVKDINIDNPLSLSTEWNHIEAALAYSLGLPLLVIHDLGITRGIFDRGVLNSFLYQKDFSDKAWAVSSDITGALSKWKMQLKPIKKPGLRIENIEKPKVKWGCFTFPPDESLYCPFCFNKEGIKMLSTRVNIKSRQCTNCKSMINTG